ncbi:DUF1257 domain-containing protein [bacterium]|nr:DUF1257 domain-containing protein [bacterium]
MSHIVTVECQVRSVDALQRGCRRLGLAEPEYRTARLFSAEATGHCVDLPDWRYPVVFDIETGQTRFDHFNGRWGDPRELDRLIQACAVEAARLEARRRGHTVTEQSLADGSIRLTVLVGGAA